MQLFGISAAETSLICFPPLSPEVQHLPNFSTGMGIELNPIIELYIQSERHSFVETLNDIKW